MGHINDKGLIELSKQDLLTSLKVESLGVCDHCILGKKIIMKFGKGLNIKNEIHEYIHANL